MFSNRFHQLARRSAYGFTLVEILVVISIIALLIALLLPALARAKGLANQIECGSNERQLAMATIEYAQDNGGAAPVYGNIQWGRNGNAVGYPFWTRLIYPYIYSSPHEIPDHARTVVDGHSLSMSEEISAGIDVPAQTVFLCPTVQEHGWLYSKYSWVTRYCSYAINEYVSGGVFVNNGEYLAYGQIHSPIPLSSLPSSSSQVILFAESNYGDPLAFQYVMGIQGWPNIYPVHQRKLGPAYVNPWNYPSSSGVSNFAFCDGHVSAYSFKVDTFSPSSSPLPPGVLLDPNNPAY